MHVVEKAAVTRLKTKEERERERVRERVNREK